MNKLVNNRSKNFESEAESCLLPDRNLDEITKMEILVLRESISAISKENDKLQMLYQKSLKNLHLSITDPNAAINAHNSLRPDTHSQNDQETSHPCQKTDLNDTLKRNTSEVQSYLED